MPDTNQSAHIPPPPPPPPLITKPSLPPPIQPPRVSPDCPAGAYMVELMVFNGHPFKDHWAYWVRSHHNPKIGIMVHADGNVRSGFKFHIRRNYDIQDTESDIPTKLIPLQWVDQQFFDNEKAMFNNGSFKFDTLPVCPFEESVCKVDAPEKSLNAVAKMDPKRIGRQIRQRDCQSWIVESAEHLVKDGMLSTFEKSCSSHRQHDYPYEKKIIIDLN